MTPRVSIILAVGGTGEDPDRCLAALAAQQADFPRFEVVIGGRGARMAADRGPAHGLEPRTVETEADPLGAAWNAAAAVSTGEILLFMQSHTVANPALVTLHSRAHLGNLPGVVVGSVRQAVDQELELARAGAGRRSSPPSPAECEGQTLSVSRDAFHRAGGFDPTLGWGAEIELAHRLITGGLELRRTGHTVAARARALSGREHSDARSAAGRGSVELYRHTPALLPSLELGGFQSAAPSALRLRRLLLALGGPRLPEAPGRLLPRGRWRDRWSRFTHDYDFWRCAMRAIRERTLRRALVRAPVILMYHAVGRPEEAAGWYVVPARRFTQQMAWLAMRRYRVLSLAELLEYRRRFELPPPRSVVITFDDGYADNHELAYPVLRAHGFVATFFLVSTRVGGRNDWDTRGELAGRPMLSWAAARELLAGGMEVGAHTRRHPVLPDLSWDEIEDEVSGACRDLEDALGTPVRTFAYPFGRYDDRVVAAVGRSGVTGACCSHSGANDPGVPGLLLRRVEIRGTDSVLRFALAVRRGRARRRPRPE